MSARVDEMATVITDLTERLAAAEKVVEAARELHDYLSKPMGEGGNVMEIRARLTAALLSVPTAPSPRSGGDR